MLREARRRASPIPRDDYCPNMTQSTYIGRVKRSKVSGMAGTICSGKEIVSSPPPSLNSFSKEADLHSFLSLYLMLSHIDVDITFTVLFCQSYHSVGCDTSIISDDVQGLDIVLTTFNRRLLLFLQRAASERTLIVISCSSMTSDHGVIAYSNYHESSSSVPSGLSSSTAGQKGSSSPPSPDSLSITARNTRSASTAASSAVSLRVAFSAGDVLMEKTPSDAGNVDADSND